MPLKDDLVVQRLLRTVACKYGISVALTARIKSKKIVHNASHSTLPTPTTEAGF